MKTAINYRPDIDGLRAIAVISVLLFHLGIKKFSGGYVGVDIFFVISGYLISSIIIANLENDNFSFKVFWIKRIRRILPAQFFLLLVCSFLSFLFLVPEDLESFGKILFSQGFFSSNIFLWLQAGYFDAPALSKPLLHTWSLALEEQFYLFLPFILFLSVKKIRKHFFKIVLSLFFLSLCVCALWKDNPSKNFYLLPSRSWELTAGVILAGITSYKKFTLNKLICEILAFVGIAFIVISVLCFDEATPFPFYGALIPVCATTLILWLNSVHKTFIFKMLTLRPLRFVGVISYSLYLWHWPIIVYYKYYGQTSQINFFEAVLIVLASLVLAFFSWVAIEQPFRTVTSFAKPKIAFTFAFVGLASCAVAGYTIGYTNFIQQFYGVKTKELATYKADRNPRRSECHKIDPTEITRGKLCHIGRALRNNEAPAFVSWGDSHADAIMPVFEKIATINGLSGKHASFSGCPPLLSVYRSNYYYELSRQCNEFNHSMLKYIIENGVKNVFLIARWNFYLFGEPNEENKVSRLTDNLEKLVTKNDGQSIFKTGLSTLMAELSQHNVKVWIVKQVPKLPFRPQLEVAKLIKAGKNPKNLGIEYQAHFNHQKLINNIFAELKLKYPEIMFIDPSSILCSTAQSKCSIIKNHDLLYYDDDHISMQGSLSLLPLLQPFIEHLQMSH